MPWYQGITIEEADRLLSWAEGCGASTDEDVALVEKLRNFLVKHDDRARSV